MNRTIRAALTAAVAVAALTVVHVAGPWQVEAVTYAAVLAAYALVVTRPEKVTVSRHLHRQTGRLIFAVFAGAARAVGMVGVVVFLGFLAVSFLGDRVGEARDAARGEVRGAVTEQAKDAGGPVGRLLDNLSGTLDRTRENRRAREATDQGATDGRPR